MLIKSSKPTSIAPAFFADDFIGKKDTDGQNGKSQTDEKYCDISIDLPTLDNEAVSKEIKDYVESKKSEFEQTAKTLSPICKSLGKALYEKLNMLMLPRPLDLARLSVIIKILQREPVVLALLVGL